MSRQRSPHPRVGSGRPLQPTGLLLAYYGDDLTGSTDVMESLARAGVETVLFLRPPTRAQLAQFPGVRAFGIAGGARALSPAQMERELPPAFRALKRSGAAFVHYKTCSTFDSSPLVGSIGIAIELGRRVFGNQVTPLVVGAPVLGRYVVFGNLFARSGLDAEPSRLDRHPTMSRHPVTPMDEADIRLHLARQTRLPIELVDTLKLATGRAENRDGGDRKLAHTLAELARRSPAPIVLFDTLQEADLPIIGRLVASQQPVVGPLFCVGSSGVEYALTAHWRECGIIAPVTATRQSPARTRRQMVVVSGSCSPVTDRQISVAAKQGFVEVACDSGSLADPRRTELAAADAVSRAKPALLAGRNVIFHTARGPGDPRRQAFARAARRHPGHAMPEKLAAAGETVGRGLALILEDALRLTGARQTVVCGGDTATATARALEIEALEFLAPVAPGGPLCRVHAPGRMAHGCAVVFKGGQVGREAFFPDLFNNTAK